MVIFQQLIMGPSSHLVRKSLRYVV
jgi:hypothetical protein